MPFLPSLPPTSIPQRLHGHSQACNIDANFQCALLMLAKSRKLCDMSLVGTARVCDHVHRDDRRHPSAVESASTLPLSERWFHLLLHLRSTPLLSMNWAPVFHWRSPVSVVLQCGSTWRAGTVRGLSAADMLVRRAVVAVRLRFRDFGRK